jgi:hypothetical protein
LPLNATKGSEVFRAACDWLPLDPALHSMCFAPVDDFGGTDAFASGGSFFIHLN